MLFTKKNKTVAIFDIGSASIGVAIVSFPLGSVSKEDSSPALVIHFTKRYQLQIADQITFKSFIDQVFTTFDQVLTEVVSQKIKINQAAIFLASPFYLAQTKVIKQSQPAGTVFSADLVQSILETKSQEVLTQHPILYPDLIGDQSYVFENVAMQIKLNGYETSNPYGQKAQTLAIAHHIAIGSQNIALRLKEMLVRHLGRCSVSFHSFTFAAFSVWRDIVPSKKSDFILLDITGEVVDVSIVHDGYLAESISFPKARNYLIRETAKALKTNNEEAYSTLKEYINKNLGNHYQEKLENILKPMKTEWLRSLSEVFSLAMESVLLPEAVYVIGDDVVARLFTAWLGDSSLAQFSLANRPLRGYLIDESKWNDYLEKNGQKPKDVFLGIETLFCQKIL